MTKILRSRALVYASIVNFVVKFIPEVNLLKKLSNPLFTVSKRRVDSAMMHPYRATMCWKISDRATITLCRSTMM